MGGQMDSEEGSSELGVQRNQQRGLQGGWGAALGWSQRQAGQLRSDPTDCSLSCSHPGPGQ